MSNKVKISVILATYNRAGTLPRAIDSILHQTFGEIELIIINDGSTDSTSDILDDYATKDSRIKIIAQKNQGLAISRNAGVAQASGKYIAFMDSDDACAVNRLEMQYKFLENNNYSACSLMHLDNIDNYIPGIKCNAKHEHIDYKNSIFSQKDWQVLSILGAHSLITKESFTKFNGLRANKEIIEDLDFTMRYRSSEYKMAALLTRGAYFYDTPENNSVVSLTNENIFIFAKRFAASLVCEWCRHNDLDDPAGNKNLDEILEIINMIPLKDRKIIYSYLDWYGILIAQTTNTPPEESKAFVLGLVSKNPEEQKNIYRWFNDIRIKWELY